MRTVQTILIPIEPDECMLQRMAAAGRVAVNELVTTSGALGVEELTERYMRRIYAAIVGTGDTACQIGSSRGRDPIASAPLSAA